MSRLSLEAVRYALFHAAGESGALCALQAGDVAIVLLDDEQRGDLGAIAAEYFGERNENEDEWDDLIFDLRNVWLDYDVESEDPAVNRMTLNDDGTLPSIDGPEWLSRFVYRYNTAVWRLSALEGV